MQSWVNILVIKSVHKQSLLVWWRKWKSNLHFAFMGNFLQLRRTFVVDALLLILNEPIVILQKLLWQDSWHIVCYFPDSNKKTHWRIFVQVMSCCSCIQRSNSCITTSSITFVCLLNGEQVALCSMILHVDTLGQEVLAVLINHQQKHLRKELHTNEILSLSFSQHAFFVEPTFTWLTWSLFRKASHWTVNCVFTYIFNIFTNSNGHRWPLSQ